MAFDSTKQTPLGPSGIGPAGTSLGGTTLPDTMQKMIAETIDYKGTKFLKQLISRENLEAMETFSVRDDDIFIITYPKCGTHWTMEIVYLILANGYPDKIDREERMKFGALEMTIRSSNNHLPAFKFVETITSRRVLPTHLPINVVPQALLQGKGKVVYVTRNPKDCLTSLFGYMSGRWNEMFEQFLSKDPIYGNFFDNILAYWKHRHDNNFLFMKYEDMKRDHRSAVLMIADHIGCVLSDEAVDRVVASSSLDQMKKSYQKAGEQGVIVGNFGKFLRKGTVGDWKNYFTVAQNETFDEYYREKMTGSGLAFQFE